jgi:hypothetical protein
MRKYVKPDIEIVGFENKDSVLTASSVKINGDKNIKTTSITYNPLGL